jgi:4-hydroxy-2-oxoglutarate aldolase
MKRFTGLYTPITTPFAVDGTLDEASLRTNIGYWIDTPLTGLVLLGSNGEAPQLDDAEADRVLAIAREAVPRDRPLIAGTGRESTRATIAATRRAAQADVDAVLVRTPSFFKGQMTSDAFVRFYTAVADASTRPVLLDHVSMYTGVNLLSDAVEMLAVHPNIVGIKESGSDMVQMSEYITRTPDDFTVLAGSATTFFAALCAGADGGVLALASLLPEQCRRLMTLVREKRIDEARDLQRQMTPLARSVGGVYGVAGLKAALDLIGYTGGMPRPPLGSVTPQVVDIIRGQLEALDALPAAAL